jgi:hypothetical protein
MMVKISDERKRALSMTMINQVIYMQQQAINNGQISDPTCTVASIGLNRQIPLKF